MIASIDIGTSYSSICVLGSDGKVYPVKVATDISLFGGDYTLPTAVFLEENGTMLVGQAAMNKSRKNPENFSWQFKRMLGQDKPVFLGGQEYPVEKLYTELIFYMKTCAEKSFGESIEKVYLTHPAAYGTGKKEKLIKAARGAGIFSVELIDEPTAAALNCCEESRAEEGQIILIYDFGGGTFDASLVRSSGESFELMAEPMGLEDCGGKDVDYFIARDMMSVVGSKAERLDRKRLDSQLLELAVKGKHHLSVSESYEEDINVGVEDVPYSLTRSRLNEGIADKVGRTIEVCAGLLNRAGVKKEELSAVWMVGGSSHIPLVQEMVKRFAGEVKVRQARDMELAVVMGALKRESVKVTDPKTEAGFEEKKIRGSISEVVKSFGPAYFYFFVKEYKKNSFLNEKFWTGYHEETDQDIREMFARSARNLKATVTVEPDLSQEPYFEWCYRDKQKSLSGSSSLGVYKNGLFVRYLWHSYGRSDRYFTWEEFLYTELKLKGAACYLGDICLIRTGNQTVTARIYTMLKDFQKELNYRCTNGVTQTQTEWEPLNSIEEVIGSLGSGYFHRFFRENKQLLFPREQVWLGPHDKRKYIKEMFAISAQEMLCRLEFKPDQSHLPYMEWCYGRPVEANLKDSWIKMDGAWSLGIYRNGIFTRHITCENGTIQYIDNYITWKEFLFGELRYEAGSSECFLQRNILIKTCNPILTEARYGWLRKLQRRLSREVSKKYYAKIIVSREKKVMSCLRTFVFICDEIEIDVKNGETRTFRVGPGIHVLKAGNKNLLDNRNDASKNEEIKIVLDIGDTYVLNLTSGETKIFRSGEN